MSYALTVREYRTWRVLRDDADRQSICRLSVDELVERTGFAVTTVLRHLERLEQLHRVLTIQRGSGRGHRSCRIVPRFFSHLAWRNRGFVRGTGGTLERVAFQPDPLLSPCTEERPHQKARSVPGSEASRRDGEAHHAPVRPLRLVERDLATREGVDGLYRRITAAGWLEPCERAREMLHGLVERARRIAQNALAFVAGVIRRGCWRVVGERDREVARDEIGRLDAVVAEVAPDPQKFVDISALMELTTQIQQRWTKPMKHDPQQVGNLYSQRMATPRVSPTTAEMEFAEEQARQLVQGRYVYSLIVHDRVTLKSAAASLNIKDQSTVRELGAKYAASAGCEAVWARAMSELGDRDVGASPTSKFGAMREAQREARTRRGPERGGEPKSIRDVMGPIFGEKRP